MRVHTQEGFEQLRLGTQFSHPHQSPTASRTSTPATSPFQPLHCTGVGWPGLSQPRPLQVWRGAGMEKSGSKHQGFSSNGTSCWQLRCWAGARQESASPEDFSALLIVFYL